MKPATNKNDVGAKFHVNAACALFLGAYVWLHGNDLFRSGSAAFAIVAIAYACYLASDPLPKRLKKLLTILAPLVAIGLMLATE
jgi:hypothetical protein